MKITKIKAVPIPDRKKNVAAYARVSSGKDAMLHSLSAQVSYYSEYIQSHGDWEYVGVYSDEALTGTKDSRSGFQQLLADCRSGKIDLVITKSVSRFARNTVTLLKAVRELKNLGVGIYFEEQNINSLSADGELMLTIIASYAQEESLSVSENCKWRIQNDFKQGNLPMCIQNIYGYKRTTDGGLEIVTDEAEVVRQIYKLFLDGKGVRKIATELNEQGIQTNSYSKWTEKKVRYILSNEKYVGDLLLQKSFSVDHLTKHRKKNMGEKPKYYVENNHKPIITREMYEAVQLEFEHRKKKHYTAAKALRYPFTGKIECGNCGKKFRRKVTVARVVWICSTFDKYGKKQCPAKQIPEETLYSITTEVLGMEMFDLDAFEYSIEKIIIPSANRLLYVFRDGHTIERTWKDRSRSESWTTEMRAQARQTTIERRKAK